MYKESTIENRIREKSLELFSAKQEVPPVFDTKRLTGRMMEWAMKHEEFKVRLFRFIDVLPSLRSNEHVVRLVQEYFSQSTDLPKFITSGIGMLFGPRFTSAVAGPVIRASMEAMARQFIAGKDAPDTMQAIEALRRDGVRFSIDLLGEVVVSDREAEEYARRYLEFMDLIRNADFDSSRFDISIKLSSLYAQMDPVDWEGSIQRIKNSLRPLLRKAERIGISITFDMEEYYHKDLTIAVFKSIFEEEEFQERPAAGIALQAYLRDAEQDVLKLTAWARERRRKITIRLVKGAYWDYEIVVNRQRGWPVPVFVEKEETDRNFERLTRHLLENAEAVRPAIATHNLRSIGHALAVADELNLSGQEFEFQVLYGMADAVLKALRQRGYTTRIYAPVGELIPGMAYLVRRLLENTSNESFLRRSFAENAAFDDLIRPPRTRHEVAEARIREETFQNEPPLDFSISLNRTKMADAIRTFKATGNHRYPLIIADHEVETGREILSRNPSDPREVVGRVCSAGTGEADRAIEGARKIYPAWRKIDPHERARYLFKAAESMRRRRFELAALEVIEVGKTWKDADADVCEAIDYLEYYGREMDRLVGTRAVNELPGEKNEYRYEPKGVGVIIAPWNFPLAIATNMISAAIVTGNCVLFKPSGLSPVLGYELADTYRSAGLPAGVLQFLPGPGKDVGEYIVSHPGIDFIAFTGSRDVGLRIVKLAGDVKKGQRNVKRVIAEMGGKNAIIVDETADLDEAVKGVMESAFGYQGQKCSACSRVIAVGDTVAELARRLADAAGSLRIGPPEDPGNFLGPVIDEAALKKVQAYREIGKKEGKAILEKNVSADGFFIGPAIFVDVPPEARIATEEIFGPILTILRAVSLDEAITMANQSDYALTGGLFSRSPAAVERVKAEFLVGNLYINRKITGALVGRQPFGGFGMSGVGSKSGGPDYLLQFLNPVSISENTLRRGFAPRRLE